MASRGSVLIIVQNLPVPFDRRVWLEARALIDAGYRVSVICPTGKHGAYKKRFEVLEGVHIYRYPAPPEAESALGYFIEFAYAWLATAMLSLGVAKKQGIDIIHACNPPETYFLLAALYKMFGKKFVFDHHDLSPEMYLAKGGRRGGILHRGLLFLEKMTFKTADVVLATNESHKQVAMERGKVPAERIYIVRSGPDFDRLRRYPPDPSLRGGYAFLACYLGEMCPQDGVDLLLHAIRDLVYVRGHRDTKFVLMGGGPSLGALRDLKHDLGLDDYVEMPGRVTDDELCRYLSTADLCLDPDPYSEWSDQSTMNKIMEYMAFGKPIVAFDLKENRRSARRAAVYAPANDLDAYVDLMLELIRDPEKRREMGEYGYNRVRKELAWEYSIPHLLAAYRRVGS